MVRKVGHGENTGRVIRLSKPGFSPETINEIRAVLGSGNLVQGQKVRQFEQILESYLDARHVIAVSSGTAALHISLCALGIGEGDGVIVPAFTFPAVANVVELAGAVPVFVDISLSDFCLDCEKIEAAVTPATKAIIPVHQFGNPVNFEAIWAIAHNHSLEVIEDAACALGTIASRRRAGALGQLGCLSFHPRKIITTGEGGAVVTNDNDLANKLRLLRNHGLDQKDQRNDFPIPGFNFRLTEIQAVLGIDGLRQINATLEHYTDQAGIYNGILNADLFAPEKGYDDGHMPNYQTYFRVLKTAGIRNRVIGALRKAGIESNHGAYAIPGLSHYQHKYNLEPVSYAFATLAYQQGIALPIGPHLSEEDCQWIANTFNQIIQHEL
jgi:perosamine synthetase